MNKYIDADAALSRLPDDLPYKASVKRVLMQAPTADVVDLVRCKDCKHFQPRFVLTAEKERRPYTEEEIKNGEIVSADVGINCGSRCERFGYWEENKIPVWFSENDYCSYGERRTDDEG